MIVDETDATDETAFRAELRSLSRILVHGYADDELRQEVKFNIVSPHGFIDAFFKRSPGDTLGESGDAHQTLQTVVYTPGE